MSERRLLRLRLPAERQGTLEHDPAPNKPADDGGSPPRSFDSAVSTELSHLRAEVAQLRADLEALERRFEDAGER